MSKQTHLRGIQHIRTALTRDRNVADERVVAMRRLVNLETKRNRLTRELQSCLQKQQQLQGQIEDLIFDIEEIQKLLGEDVTFQKEASGQVQSKLRSDKGMKSEQLVTKQFIIEY